MLLLVCFKMQSLRLIGYIVTSNHYDLFISKKLYHAARLFCSQIMSKFFFKKKKVNACRNVYV